MNLKNNNIYLYINAYQILVSLSVIRIIIELIIYWNTRFDVNVLTSDTY